MTRDRNYSRRLLTIFSACILAALALVVSSAHVGVSPAPTRTLTSSVYDHLVQHSGAKSAVAAVRHRDVSLDRSGNEQVDPAPNSALAVAADTAPSVIRAGELKLPGVPKGATGTVTRNGDGLTYAIPRGTPELDPRVTQIRIMNPTTGKNAYPNGYAVYMNDAEQRVNPLTGQMIHDLSDPYAHIPLP